MENGARHFAEYKRYETIREAEGEAEGETGDKPPAIRLHIAVEPFIRTPPDPDCLPER